MTTSAISGTTSTTTTSSSSTSSSVTTAYNTFLTLLTTQLTHQDPTNPTDASTFTSQLIGLAQIEQMESMNTQLTTLVDSVSSLMTTSGLGYLGKTVGWSDDTAPMQDGAVSWNYSLPSDATSVTLTVTDEDGTVVATQSGETASGAHAFTWDGTGSDGTQYTSGDYTLTVTAVDSSGKTLSATTTAIGKVSGVDTSTGSIVLSCGDITVDSSAITGVTS